MQHTTRAVRQERNGTDGWYYPDHGLWLPRLAGADDDPPKPDPEPDPTPDPTPQPDPKPDPEPEPAPTPVPPVTRSGEPIPRFVEFRPGNGLRYVFGTFFTLFSVAAVIAIFWAVSEGSTNAILGAAGLTALAMGAWWALLNWTPAIVSISNGILEISRGTAADSWDLAHEETDLTYSGKPGSRSWKATLTGNDGKKHVITRSAVDPAQFVEIVEHYRTR